jgi:hypothetical protein
MLVMGNGHSTRYQTTWRERNYSAVVPLGSMGRLSQAPRIGSPVDLHGPTDVATKLLLHGCSCRLA